MLFAQFYKWSTGYIACSIPPRFGPPMLIEAVGDKSVLILDARFHMGGGRYRFIVIGTAYGYWHTTGGDVRTWKTASGARKAAKRYVPL